jgi:hypothetical protein
VLFAKSNQYEGLPFGRKTGFHFGASRSRVVARFGIRPGKIFCKCTSTMTSSKRSATRR